MKFLAFDMDNTICNTSESVINKTITAARVTERNDILEFITDESKNIPVCKYPKWVSEFIYENVIIKRDYMDIAKPTYLVDGLVSLIEKIRVTNPEIKIIICTHRGDNIDAFMSTYNWLNSNGLIEYFDIIHSISHIRHPNKIDFLKRRYATENFLLVDDNPFGSTSTVREFCKNVVIFNEIDKHPSHLNQVIFTDHEDLYNRVCAF